MKVTSKDQKDFKRSIKTLAKKLRDNERYHEYKPKEGEKKMFENMKPAQRNHIMKVTRKDQKDFKRSIKTLTKKLRDNERYHKHKYNGLEIYITIYPGKHPTIQLTTNYFPHTFSSNPKDIGLYNKDLTWANLQGCWDDDQKMYEFVTTHLINYE